MPEDEREAPATEEEVSGRSRPRRVLRWLIAASDIDEWSTANVVGTYLLFVGDPGVAGGNPLLPRPCAVRGVIPDLLFPVDRSWLASRLWDDDWRCLGGPADLVAPRALAPLGGCAPDAVLLRWWPARHATGVP